MVVDGFVIEFAIGIRLIVTIVHISTNTRPHD
jgi:hypothetical protein